MIRRLAVLATLLAPVMAGAADLQDGVLLDFGEADGAVFEGFSLATPFAIDHADATWAAGSPRSQSQPWSDPLVDDQIVGGTLHLDLAPGDYAVGALFDEGQWGLRPPAGQPSGLRTPQGDLVVEEMPADEAFFASRAYAANPTPTFRPDQAGFDRQIAPTLRWRTASISVGDAGLDVESFGAGLAALVVAPIDRADLEVELALIDARRRAWSLAHKPDTDTTGLPWASDAPLGLERVAWDQLPVGTPTPAIDVDVAPGQRVSLLLALHGTDAPAQVAIEGLDALEVELWEVTWLDVVERSVRRVRPHVLRPTEGELRGGQGLAPMLAIRFRLPDDADPAELSGTVRVKRGDDEARLPLQVRVRDLHLAEPTTRLGVWADLRAVAAQVYGPDDPRTQAVWANDVQVMRTHDVDVLCLRGLFYPGPSNMVAVGVPRDRLRWAFDAWRSAGGGRGCWVDPVFTLMRGETPDDETDPLTAPARAWLADAMAASAELDIDAYLIDEAMMAHGPGHRGHTTRLLDALNDLNADAGARLAAAVPHAAAWPLAAAKLDLVFLNRFPRLDPQHFAFFEGQRATPYAYNLSFHREATALYGWVLGTNAIVIWHWNEPYNDPFNDLRARPQYQLAILAPDGKTVWPTRRIEDLSLGMQDHRYIVTVAGLVDEVGHKRKSAPTIDRACALLRAAGSGIVGRQPEDFGDLGLFDDASLDDLQRELGDVGEQLARWSKTQRALRKGRSATPTATRWPKRCGPAPWLRSSAAPAGPTPATP